MPHTQAHDKEENPVDTDTDYELEVAYATDPEGTTARVIAQAAAAAAAEVAAQHDARRSEEFERVQRGQIESATHTALGELEQKYGKAEVERLGPQVYARIEQSPHLCPPELYTSPVELAKALDDVMQLVRVESKAERTANHWQAVKDSKETIFTWQDGFGR